MCEKYIYLSPDIKSVREFYGHLYYLNINFYNQWRGGGAT
jgi:hypothetical protein